MKHFLNILGAIIFGLVVSVDYVGAQPAPKQPVEVGNLSPPFFVRMAAVFKTPVPALKPLPFVSVSDSRCYFPAFQDADLSSVQTEYP